jgi:hypothetical protein
MTSRRTKHCLHTSPPHFPKRELTAVPIIVNDLLRHNGGGPGSSSNQNSVEDSISTLFFAFGVTFEAFVRAATSSIIAYERF